MDSVTLSQYIGHTLDTESLYTVQGNGPVAQVSFTSPLLISNMLLISFVLRGTTQVITAAILTLEKNLSRRLLRPSTPNCFVMFENEPLNSCSK